MRRIWAHDNNDTPMPNPLEQIRFPAQYVEVFEALVSHCGSDTSALLQRCGLVADRLLQPDAWVTGVQMQQMLRICQEVAQPARPLSAQLLDHFPVTAHGTLGIVVLTSPNLRAALDAALRFYPVVMPVYDILRQDIGEEVHLVFRPLYDFGDVSEALTETILGVFNSIRRYINPHLPLLEIHFAHAARFPLEQYASFADPQRLKFDQPCNRIVLPKVFLDSPLSTSNRSVMQRFEQQLERQIQELSQTRTFSRQVREHLDQALREGKSQQIEDIAAVLNMSSRTLSRRLRQEGNQFKELVNQARIDYAERLLLTSRKAVSQIGYAAGFQNDSSFARAFRRRKGISPTQLRKRLER